MYKNLSDLSNGKTKGGFSYIWQIRHALKAKLVGRKCIYLVENTVNQLSKDSGKEKKVFTLLLPYCGTDFSRILILDTMTFVHPSHFLSNCGYLLENWG